MADYRVLVVEDSPTMSQLLKFTLKRIKDLEVVTARDGVDGLKKLAHEKYDLVLTDINMPLMDGLKLIGLVRGDGGQNRSVPIVIITTEGEEDARKEGMSLGATSYITKPINSREVIDTVMKCLGTAV
ncbi:Chemotaxis protein CheY [Anaerolineae bacterium]|nr:Chemotaxis protein CheY [Anaerolineae bacterium]